jgi:2TM domain-containing protein
MENYKPAPEGRDPKLWEIAQKRASFRSGFITYVIVIAFLWGIWYFTSGRDHRDSWPWPIWPTLGWGLGMVFQYFKAYVNPESNSVENEYEKLKRKQ